METNFLIFPLAALIPLVVGAVYYNPRVLGSFWMSASGVTEAKAQSGNMAKIFGLAYLFSLFIAFMMEGVVVHQMSIHALFFTDPSFSEAGSEINTFFSDFMAKYGDRHRSFGHGVLHGVLAGVLFAWPLIGIISLFERRGWKYTAVHTGYWLIALALMGGVICQFA